MCDPKVGWRACNKNQCFFILFFHQFFVHFQHGIGTWLLLKEGEIEVVFYSFESFETLGVYF
jgi:hypothetical protein